MDRGAELACGVRPSSPAAGAASRRAGQSALIVDGVRLLDRQLAALRSLTDTILLVRLSRSCARIMCRRARPPARHRSARAIATALSVSHDRARCWSWRVDLPFPHHAHLEFLGASRRGRRCRGAVSGGRWQPLCAMPASRAAPVLDAAIDRGELAVHAAVARLNPTLIAGDSLAPFDPEHRLFANINTPGRPRTLGREQRPESCCSP